MRTLFLCFFLLGACAHTNAVTLADAIARTTVNPNIKLKHTLEAFGGNLLGFNGREHGGMLLFADLNGQATAFDIGNVKGFGQVGDRVFIFTGTVYPKNSEGTVKELTRRADGQLDVRLLQDLHGTPSRVRRRGDHMVEFEITRKNAQGDSLPSCALLYADGRIEPAPCAPI